MMQCRKKYLPCEETILPLRICPLTPHRAESGLNIMAACMPALRQVFGQYFPRGLGIFKKSSQTGPSAETWIGRDERLTARRRHILSEDETSLAPTSSEQHISNYPDATYENMTEVTTGSGMQKPMTVYQGVISEKRNSNVQQATYPSETTSGITCRTDRTIQYEVNTPVSPYFPGGDGIRRNHLSISDAHSRPSFV